MSEVSFKKAGSNGKATRVMSLSMVAAMLDVSRNTVLAWKRDGCPVEKEATKKGESDQMDIAEVVRWRIAVEKEATADAARKAHGLVSPTPGGADDGGETKEQADTRRARALADIAEVEAAEAYGSVAPIARLETILREEHAAARANFENLGSALADRTAPITDPATVKEIADKLVRQAVKPYSRSMLDKKDETDEA